MNLPPRFYCLPVETRIWALSDALRIAQIQNKKEQVKALESFRVEWNQRTNSLLMCPNLFPDKLWIRFLASKRTTAYKKKVAAKQPKISNALYAKYMHLVKNRGDLKKLLRALAFSSAKNE